MFVREPTTRLSVELDCHFPAGCEKATSEWFQSSRNWMEANRHFMISLRSWRREWTLGSETFLQSVSSMLFCTQLGFQLQVSKNFTNFTNLYELFYYCSLLLFIEHTDQNQFDNPCSAFKFQQSSRIDSEVSRAEYLLSGVTIDLPKETKELQQEEIVHSNVSRWIEEFPHIGQYYKH